LCGFPKDAYYFYQSQWTTKPVIHLSPHWNWKGKEGQVIQVMGVRTNSASLKNASIEIITKKPGTPIAAIESLKK
jgi:hypothetical protein